MAVVAGVPDGVLNSESESKTVGLFNPPAAAALGCSSSELETSSYEERRFEEAVARRFGAGEDGDEEREARPIEARDICDMFYS